ncbi:helix-turn-helix domain-containing protein [Microbacterium suaedae]|uniref:helix-turn-helix domain-containing protein n=1 Tax=Microbacterium suaedae TaxID=2067813 RepID=UPI0013A684E1|nr:helix-turn-helix domain-containing protein [Microbacterium suaedae]
MRYVAISESIGRGRGLVMPEDRERLDIREAADRKGCSPNTIYHLVQTGALASELAFVVGRRGRVRKHLIRVEDLEAHFSTEETERYIAAIDASAPPLTAEQKARVAAVFKSARRR